jgi:catechol 2,3-dioxygenase-like lactoylglutathione lyase family enzyme
MLPTASLLAFVPTTDVGRARSFYEGVLGLRVLDDDGFACVVEAHGAPLRITAVEALTPHPFTVLGWEVPDVAAAVDDLVGRGISFVRYPQIEQDERGIWTTPTGTRVAWFRDPDANVLSVSQPA